MEGRCRLCIVLYIYGLHYRLQHLVLLALGDTRVFCYYVEKMIGWLESPMISTWEIGILSWKRDKASEGKLILCGIPMRFTIFLKAGVPFCIYPPIYDRSCKTLWKKSDRICKLRCSNLRVLVFNRYFVDV